MVAALLLDFVDHDNVLRHRVKIGAGDENDTVALGEQTVLAAPPVDEGTQRGSVVHRSAGQRRDTPVERKLPEHGGRIAETDRGNEVALLAPQSASAAAARRDDDELGLKL